MNRDVLPSMRAAVRVARWKMEISAVMTAMGVAIAVVPPVTRAGNRTASDLTRVTAASFSRVSAIPSHHGRYRASLVPWVDRADRSDSTGWAVTVETVTGAAVGDATLVLESWMPDDDHEEVTRSRVTRYLGDGRYRVEGLRFGRRGWWNVRLQIARPGDTDSLAFNLIR